MHENHNLFLFLIEINNMHRIRRVTTTQDLHLAPVRCFVTSWRCCRTMQLIPLLCSLLFTRSISPRMQSSKYYAGGVVALYTGWPMGSMSSVLGTMLWANPVKLSPHRLHRRVTLAHIPPIGVKCGGGGSQQREVADGADVVFTDTDQILYNIT